MTASLIPGSNTTHHDINVSEGPEAAKSSLRAVQPLQVHPPLHLVTAEGRLQVHTAPCRGSFSTVLSEAIRAAGLGSRVMVAQFLKGGVNQGPNGSIQLCGQLEWLRPAIPGCITEPLDNNFLNSSLLKDAVESIWEICRTHLLKGDLDQLVLDEIGLAISYGYLKEEEVLATLKTRLEGMDVILTGTSIPTGITAIADQVTELRSGF